LGVLTTSADESSQPVVNNSRVSLIPHGAVTANCLSTRENALKLCPRRKN